jgi:hypothetical protein
MSGIFNRLVGTQATLSTFNVAGAWASDDLTIAMDTTSELWPGSANKQLALAIPSPSTSGTISLTSAEIELEDLTHPIIFTCGVKMPSGGSVEISLGHSSQEVENSVITTRIFAGSTPVVNAVGVANPQWNIVRANPITPVSNVGTVGMSIHVTFYPTDPTETIYFTLPVLCQNFEFVTRNRIFLSVMGALPEVFRLIDLEQTGELEMPLARLVDVFTNGLDKAFYQLGHYAYLDIVDGFDDADDTTKSHLVNQDVADFATLLWLCKFNGTRPVTRYESSLDVVTTPFILGDELGSGSELDSGDGLLLTSYSELNPPALTLTAQEELLRWQLDYGYYGINSGTLPAVIDAAKRQLTGTKTLAYSFDFDVEPWVINLESEWYETYGATGVEEVGESSKLVLNAVEYARPLGVKVNHIMTNNV